MCFNIFDRFSEFIQMFGDMPLPIQLSGMNESKPIEHLVDKFSDHQSFTISYFQTYAYHF